MLGIVDVSKYKGSPSSKKHGNINRKSTRKVRNFSDILRDKRWKLARKVVFSIWRNGGTATFAELLHKLNISRSRLSKTLKRLEEVNVVKRIKKKKTVAVELIDPSVPFSFKNAETLHLQPPTSFFSDLSRMEFSGVWLDNVRGYMNGRYIGGDRGIRLNPQRISWFERVSYAEVGALFSVSRVPMSNVMVYWSERDRKLVVEARPRANVIKRGISPFRAAADGFAHAVVGALEALARVGFYDVFAHQILLNVLKWIKFRFGGLVCV